MANIKFTQLPNLGNITPTTIVPVVSANINYSVTAANLQTYVNSTTGNITANYFIGNGSALTGLPATYSNSNVSAYLQVLTSDVSTTGNIIANYFIGDGSQLTNLPLGDYSNANVANYLPIYSGNITSVVEVTATGNLTGSNLYTPGVVSAGGNVRGSNINTVGNVSATGNITGNYYVGNGSQLTGIVSSYGNSNVQQVLQTYTGTLTAATVSATGNITGNYLFGNGSQITGINVATTYGNANVSAYLASGTNTANIITTANVQGSFVKGNGSALTGLVSSLVAGNGISISGSTGTVTITNNNPNPYGNSNVASYLASYTGNITANGISLIGNVYTSQNYIGNGATLSNLVTSISAGNGISVNASTGAITISATGPGATGITNGTSNVTIPSANGNIVFSAGGNTLGNFTATSSYGGPGLNFANTWVTQNQVRTTYIGLWKPATGTYTTAMDFNLSGGNAGTGVGSLNMNGGNITGVNILAATTLTLSGNVSFSGAATFNSTATFNNSINVVAGTTTIGVGAIFNQTPKTKTGTSTGTPGDVAWDTTYIYVCTSTNVWKRVQINSF